MTGKKQKMNYYESILHLKIKRKCLFFRGQKHGWPHSGTQGGHAPLPPIPRHMVNAAIFA